MNDTPTVVNLFAGIHGCSRSPVGAPAEAEAAPGWGTRREQLLSFIDEFELERAPTMDEIAGERHATQVGLNFGSGSEATV